MRTLRRNRKKLWLVRPTGYTDKVDSQGNYTGEKIATYAAPVAIELSTYPRFGQVEYVPQGMGSQFDYYALSTSVELLAGDLIFKEEPTGDYDKTFDFKVSDKLESVNVTRYGLKARV